jgi:hypothetical protein
MITSSTSRIEIPASDVAGHSREIDGRKGERVAFQTAPSTRHLS